MDKVVLHDDNGCLVMYNISKQLQNNIEFLRSTAAANIDYEEQGINVIIPAGTTTYTVLIQTKKNTNQTNNTEFKVILSLPGNCGSARLVEDMASVTICDDRSEYALSQSVL